MLGLKVPALPYGILAWLVFVAWCAGRGGEEAAVGRKDAIWMSAAGLSALFRLAWRFFDSVEIVDGRGLGWVALFMLSLSLS